MAQIRSKPFGVTKEGANVTEYILSNPGGMSVSVLDYGCVIKNIIVPAKNGPVDVVLGHDTMADYENDFTSSGSTCCGAFVGRYANRIENAVFTLGGKTYQLEKNNGENHLHGCFSRKIYEVKYFGDTLLMEAVSPDGEDGFPGTLKIAVRYTLTDDNTFRMDYRVSSDADTIVNLTNHSYFNLDGGGDVLNQKLRIYASRYLEGNNTTCPTGNILPVANTPMDFTAGKTIGKEIDTGFSQTTMVGGGYDHCYVIDRARGSSQSICAWATSDKTGISMKLYTTQPGIQLYTGNFLQDCPAPGKGGEPALSVQPLSPGVPLHGAAGRQGVPRHHHPAVLHRQTVRKALKMIHYAKTSASADVFAWWEAATEGVSLSISMFCTNGAFSPCEKCEKSLSIKSAMREDATKIYLNKESAPCSRRQKAVCFKQTGQRPAQRDKSDNTM